MTQPAEQITIEQYNRELAEAEAEYQAGDYISSEELLQLIKTWGSTMEPKDY